MTLLILRGRTVRPLVLTAALATLSACAGPAVDPVAGPTSRPAIVNGEINTLAFFGWDSAELSDRSRQMVAEFALNARRVGSTHIVVAGHADRSGTPQHNQSLSQRRAETVAAEMIRLGIPRNHLKIHVYGESLPLAATADGVREPQNRRVEVLPR